MKSITKNNGSRYVYLDFIKIIAAIMVVFYHFRSTDLGSFINGQYVITFDRVFTNISAACVPLFFMVNGALVLNKDYSIEKIYYKAAKIALLLFVWSVVDFPAWFFKTLIVLYLLYPIFKKIYRNKALSTILMTAVFVFPFLYNLGMTVFAYAGSEFSIHILSYEISLASLPLKTGAKTMYSILYFFLGGYLFKSDVNQIDIHSPKKVLKYVALPLFTAASGLVILTFDGIICANYSQELQDTVNGYFPTIGALLLTVGIFRLCQLCEWIRSDKIKHIIHFFGSKVLCVYLLHLSILQIFFTYIFTGKTFPAVFILFVSISVFVVCCFISCVLEKIPLIKELIKI